MILLQRTRDAAQLKGFSGKPLRAKLEKLLQYYYQDGENVNFKIKSRQVWGKAKTCLKSESFGKCAYCEADTAVVAHGDVEHFRPKSAYWWLAYCFDNYTFSCQICNQSYKGDKFPILGKKLGRTKLPKAMPSTALAIDKILVKLSPDPAAIDDKAARQLFGAEDADLPYPYLDDAEKLFAWKANDATKEVRLIARGKSARALRAVKAAEGTLGLNRTELLRLRWLAYHDLETRVLLFQNGNFDAAFQKKMLAELKATADPEHAFAAMKRYFLRKWGLLA